MKIVMSKKSSQAHRLPKIISPTASSSSSRRGRFTLRLTSGLLDWILPTKYISCEVNGSKAAEFKLGKLEVSCNVILLLKRLVTEMEYVVCASYNTFTLFKINTTSIDIYGVLRCCVLLKNQNLVKVMKWARLTRDQNISLNSAHTIYSISKKLVSNIYSTGMRRLGIAFHSRPNIGLRCQRRQSYNPPMTSLADVDQFIFSNKKIKIILNFLNS